MDRRSFLKNAALAGAAAAIIPSIPQSCTDKGKRQEHPSAEMAFGPDGRFKLLQFTDTHYISGDPRSERAMRCVEEALDAEKPDLVIHTGDLLFGRPDIESAIEILKPISERGIPFAVALGNHDSQFGSTRQKVFSAIRELPGCLNTAPKDGVYGCSNDAITLGKGPEWVFYLFDSMDAVILKGEEEIHCYDFIRHSQIGWYRSLSGRFSEKNGGRPVPSLAFLHIPLREVEDALRSEGTELIGNNCEPPCPSRLNSGLIAQFRELQDVQAIVMGHDHDCDYVLRDGPLFHIYGRFSGCDTVYNHLGRNGVSEERISGCRLFEFESGNPGFVTKVRLYGGEVQQPLYLSGGKVTRL